VKIVRKTPRENDEEEEEEKEGGGVTTTSEAARGTTSPTAAAAVTEDKSAVHEQKEEKEEKNVDQPVSLPQLPSSTSLNNEHKQQYDAYAAKALKMKQKAALRHHSKSPSVFSAGNPKQPSTSSMNTNNSTTTTTATKRKKVKSKSHRDPLIDLRREVEILRNVGSNHPNVVTLREIVDDPTSNKMLIVMEYCEGGPVMTRAGLERGRRIPECVARLYFRDMIAALRHLHKNRIIHGDLKPENALMNAHGRIALSDFGCSKILPPLPLPHVEAVDSNLENDVIDRCNGTPAFLAPEMMIPGAKFRGKPADVYSLGTCLFTFIFGRIPFAADSVFELFKIVKTQKLTFPDIPADASTEVKALLEGLLEKDPEKRMTLDKAAAHEWTTDNGRLPCVDISAENNLGNFNSTTSSTFMTPTSTPTVDSTFVFEDIINHHIQDGDASLAGLVNAPGVEIQTFLPGQVLLRQGDRSTTCIMYILKGQVDVLYRPSEEVMKGVQQVNAPTKKENKKDRHEGGGGLRGAKITKIWSPSSRLKKRAAHRRTPAPSPTTTTTTTSSIPSLDLQRAAGTFSKSTSAVSSISGGEMLSAAHNATATSTPRTTTCAPISNNNNQPSGDFISPREHSLLLGLGTTPEPSPRLPIHSTATSTGALSSSFQLHQGLVTGFGVGAGSSYSIDSAVTTPAITPLPSARGSESAPPDRITGAGGLGGDGPVEKEQETTAATTTATSTPGSGDNSKLAAYPLQLTSTDVAENGDLDSLQGTKGSIEVNLATSTAGTAAGAGATFSPSPILNPSRSSSTPIPTINEEGEAREISIQAHPCASRESRRGHGGGDCTGDEYEYDDSIQNGGTGLVRPESGASWAPDAHTEQATLACECAETSYGIVDKSAKDHINTDQGFDRTAVAAGIDASSCPKIPCALAEAAEEALGFIKSLYRGTDSYAGNSDSAGDTREKDGTTSSIGGEFLLAVRCAGDFIGETALIEGRSVGRSCSFRASVPSSTVTTTEPHTNNAVGEYSTSSNGVEVAVIPYSVAKEYLKTHPLAKQRLAEMVWLRQSETIVLEGLLRIAAVSKELHEEARIQLEKL